MIKQTGSYIVAWLLLFSAFWFCWGAILGQHDGYARERLRWRIAFLMGAVVFAFLVVRH